MVSRLDVHAFLPSSHANGPGLRAVIWTQGCARNCPGCFNPSARSYADGDGERIPVDALFERIKAMGNRIEGISVSGGEPLEQAGPLIRLLQRVKAETDLSVLVFTGYNWEEVERLPLVKELLPYVDVVVAGPYQCSRHVGRGLLGSANQSIHLLTSRYRTEDIESVPVAEVIINPGGDVVITGIEGETVRRALAHVTS